jgi:hypothetical protein
MYTKKLTMLVVITVISLLSLVTLGGRQAMAQIVVDTDGDGVPDEIDQCPASNLSSTVVIDGCDSGVSNTLFQTGCTISDVIAQCAVDAKNHGKYVSCVARQTNSLKRSKAITGKQKGAIQSCAAQADIP